jgi:hypothetical protein
LDRDTEDKQQNEVGEVLAVVRHAQSSWLEAIVAGLTGYENDKKSAGWDSSGDWGIG